MQENIKSVKSSTEIEEWLVEHVATLMELDRDAIDSEASFETFGIDSITMVEITANLENWLDVEIDPEALYKYPTISAVAVYMEEQLKSKG